MDLPDNIADFWSRFLASTDRDDQTPLFDVFYFGDSEALAASLAELVLSGNKIATSALVWDYEAEQLRAPRRGDLSVVTAWSGEPLCVIEITDVQVVPFDDVDADFAAAEGEGDRSLEYWREAHWSFFGRMCASLGRERSRTMPVVCSRFEMVYREDFDSSDGESR